MIVVKGCPNRPEEMAANAPGNAVFPRRISNSLTSPPPIIVPGSLPQGCTLGLLASPTYLRALRRKGFITQPIGLGTKKENMRMGGY